MITLSRANASVGGWRMQLVTGGSGDERDGKLEDRTGEKYS